MVKSDDLIRYEHSYRKFGNLVLIQQIYSPEGKLDQVINALTTTLNTIWEEEVYFINKTGQSDKKLKATSDGRVFFERRANG